MKKDKVRVTFISHDARMHGATRSMIDIADLIRDDNTFSHVIIPSSGIIEPHLLTKHLAYSVANFPLMICFGKPTSVTIQIKKLVRAILGLPSFLKAVKDTKPDIIYVNSAANYWALVLKFFVKTPLVFHIREFGKEDHDMSFNLKGLLFLLLKNRPDLTISNSQAVYRYFRHKYGIESTVVYNGVYPKSLFDTNLEGRVVDTDSTIKIGIVGNIIEGKGQLDVVKAMQMVLIHFPQTKLYIIGDGWNKGSIEEYIQEHDLSGNVVITGFSSDITAYYKILDIVVVNAVMEAFGRVTIEAASFGIPVLGRDSGGTSELITDMKTGVLHDGTVEDIAKKLILLIENKSLRKEIGSNGWEIAKEKFSLESSIPQIKSLIFKLI